MWNQGSRSPSYKRQSDQNCTSIAWHCYRWHCKPVILLSSFMHPCFGLSSTALFICLYLKALWMFPGNLRSLCSRRREGSWLPGFSKGQNLAQGNPLHDCLETKGSQSCRCCPANVCHYPFTGESGAECPAELAKAAGWLTPAAVKRCLVAAPLARHAHFAWALLTQGSIHG